LKYRVDDDDDDDEGRINFSMALSPKTTRTRNNKLKLKVRFSVCCGKLTTMAMTRLTATNCLVMIKNVNLQKLIKINKYSFIYSRSQSKRSQKLHNSTTGCCYV